MGADIHGVVQTRRKNNPEAKWVNELEVESSRNYWLFSVLADVRNHNDFTPVDNPRGLPGDFELYDLSVTLYWNDIEVWMGDHSFTHYTPRELLDWDGWDQVGGELGDRGTVREACHVFLKWLEYVEAKYTNIHKDVRIVIGFDS